MSKPFYDKSFKLGVLGGGQLGKMLIQEAVNLNINVCVLEPFADAPCSKLAAEFTVGSITDYDTVYQFGKNKDIVTIEIENVNIEALKQLQKEGVKVFPSPEIIELIQDKGLQKEFYTQHNIPTAPYILVNNKKEVSEHLAKFPFAQKLRKGGYDGKGVQLLKSESDLSKAFDAPCVLEQLVDFEKELAVIVARNEQGEVATFPVVEMEFNPDANLVEFLFSPADVSETISNNAREIAVNVAKAFNLVGILAVELFLLKDGSILVNECAPRPHNSGHQTIEGNYTSQYAQHLRSILNLPLGNTDIKLPSVMVNLLGEKGFSGAANYEGLEACLQKEGVYIHLYGKTETKPFRKMGHVTIVHKDLEKAKENAYFVKRTLKCKA
ncbi:MAG: 5-(carboxyamino)imidazole ribonucleotide synthase [Bacteroidia bacterium]